MVTPQEIRRKALIKYLEYLRHEYSGDNTELFPLFLRCDKSLDYENIEKAIVTLQDASKEKLGYGYSIKWQRVRTRKLFNQNVPRGIYFSSEYDYLKYIDKIEFHSRVKEIIDRTIVEFPELKDCIIKKHKLIYDYYDRWDDVLKVCRFFRDNHKPGKFVRELPIGVHTKFVEESKDVLRPLLDIIVGEDVNKDADSFYGRFNMKEGDPVVSFRILDGDISSRYFSGLTYNTAFVYEFARLNIPVENVIIVENMHNMHKLIELLPEKKNILVVWGCGYSATVLKYAEWLNNVNLYYWGDIDVQGYEILSNVRKYFPHIVSIMMDKEAVDAHPVKVTGKPSKVNVTAGLTESEKEVYNYVKENNLRFEQEFLPESYVNECLNRIS